MTGASERDGYTIVPDFLKLDARLTVQSEAVYQALLMHVDRRTRTCFPGRATIARVARVSRKTVERTLPLLAALGYITIEHRQNGDQLLSNLYTLHVVAPNDRPIGTRDPSDSQTLGSDSQTPGGSDSQTPGGIDSQTRGSDSETREVATGRRPNQNHKNQIHDVQRRAKDESADDDAGAPAPKARRSAAPYSESFEHWWASYPRREGKRDAFKAFEHLRKNGDLPELDELIERTQRYAATRTDPRYTKLPAGWLREGRYDDDLTSAPAAKQSEGARQMSSWLESRGSSLAEYEQRKGEPGWLEALKQQTAP